MEVPVFVVVVVEGGSVGVVMGCDVVGDTLGVLVGPIVYGAATGAVVGVDTVGCIVVSDVVG